MGLVLAEDSPYGLLLVVLLDLVQYQVLGLFDVNLSLKTVVLLLQVLDVLEVLTLHRSPLEHLLQLPDFCLILGHQSAMYLVELGYLFPVDPLELPQLVLEPMPLGLVQARLLLCLLQAYAK